MRTGIAASLLVAAVVAVYANSFQGAFQFDDLPAILENPTLRHPGDLAGVLAPPGDLAGTVGGRPVVNLSLALNYRIGGTEVRGYHLFNVAVHAGAALLLYGVVRRTLLRTPGPAAGAAKAEKEFRPWASPWAEADGRLIAFFTALLWAVHPLQTEAVTYVVQRAESLMGLFYLLTLYGFIRYTERSSAGRSAGIWAGGAILACLLGMATKEVMVSAPLVILLYDRTFVAGSVRAAWRQRRGFYLGLGATWVLLGVLVAGTHGRGGSVGFSAGATWPYLLTQCRAIAHYLWLAVWPAELVFDYGTALVGHPAEVIGPGLFVVLLLGGSFLALRRRAVVGFLGVWFLVVLAPSSSVVPIVTEPMAEHRMYLPLAALLVGAVATGLFLLKRAAPRGARAAFCGVGMIAALGLGAATIRRNRDYHSEIALWTDTVHKVPENPRAHNNLAEAFRAAGQSAEAGKEFAAAVQVDPDYAPAQYNLGVTLLDAGHPQEAMPHLEKALAAPRHQAELQQFLGEAHERLGQRPDAIAHFREAWRLAPDNAAAAVGLGNNLAVQGDYAGAVAAFRRAVALAPGDSRVRNDLATALAFAGRLDEAVVEYRETLRRDPGNEMARENLDQILKQTEANHRH